jgi:hypothetical protein
MPNTTQPGPHTQNKTQDRVGLLLKRMTLAQIGLESLDHIDEGTQQTLLSTHQLAEKISRSANRLGARAMTLDPLKGLPKFLNLVQERSLPLAIDTSFAQGPQAAKGPRSPSDVGPWQDWINAVYLMLFDEDEDADEAGAKKPQYSRQQVRQAVTQRIAAQKQVIPGVSPEERAKQERASQVPVTSLEALLARLPGSMRPEVTAKAKGFLGATDQERESLFQHVERLGSMSALVARLDEAEAKGVSGRAGAEIGAAAGVVGQSVVGQAGAAAAVGVGARGTSAGVLGARGRLPGVLGVQALGVGAQHVGRLSEGAAKMSPAVASPVSARAMRPMVAEAGEGEMGFKLSAVFDALGESALGIAQWVDSATTSREGYRTEVSGSLLALLPEGEVESAYRQVSAAPASKVSASTRLQDVARLERLEQLKLEQARVERLRLEQLRAENLKVVGAEELRRGGMKPIGEPADLLGRLRQLVQSPTAAGQLMQWLSDAPTAKLLAGVQLEKGSPAMVGGLAGLAPLGALGGVQAAVRVGERSATMGEAAATGQGVISGLGRGAERMSVAYALQKVLQRAQAGQGQAGQGQAGQGQAGQGQAGQGQAGQGQVGQAWLGQSAAVRAGAMGGVAPAGQRSSVALFGDVAVDGRYLGSLSRGLDVAADSEQRYSRFMSEARVGGRVGEGLERSDSGAYARNMFEQGTLLSGMLEGEAASEPVKARQRTAETGLTKQAIESLRKMGISAVSLSEILPGLSEVIEQQRQLSQRAFQLQNPDVRVQIAPNAAEPARKTTSGLPITNRFTATSAVTAASGLQAALQQALTVALEKQKNVGLSQPGALAAMAPHGLSASALKALSGQARVTAGESSMSSLRLISAEPSHLLRMVDRLQDQVFVGQVAVDKAYVSALGASLELVSSVDGRAERFDAGRVTAQQAPEAMAMVGRTNQMLSLVHAPDVTAAMAASREQRDAKGVMASQGAGVGVAAGAEVAALTRDANRAADAMLPAPMMKAMERLGVKVMRLSDVVPGLSELVRQEKVQGLDGGTLTGQRHLRSLQKQAEQALKQTNSAAFASQDEGTQRAVQALVQQVTQLKQSMHLGDLGRMQGVERAVSKLAMEFVQSGGRPEVAAEISRTLGALNALNQEGVGSAGAAPIKAQAAKSIGAIERLEALLSERALIAAAAGVRGASLSAAEAQGAMTLRSGIGSADKVSLRAQAAAEGGLTLRHSAGALMELVSQKGLQATGARQQQLSLDVKRRGYAALEPVTERFVPSLMMSQGQEKVADGHRRSQALSAEFGLPETGELIRVSYSPDTLEAMVEARQQKQMSRESVVTGRSSFDLALKRVLKDGASSPQDIAKALERSLPGLVVQSATANQATERALVQGEQRRAADVMRRVGLRLHQAQLETQRSNRSAYIDVSADWERAWVSVFAPKVSSVKGEPVGGATPSQRFGMEEPAKVASSGVFSRGAANELRMDVPELSLVQLAQASRQADARAQVGGGDVQQRAAAAASMGQGSVSQSRLGQLSGWSGLSGALSDSVLAKVGTTQRAGAGRGEQALVQPTQRLEAERGMRAAEARVSERLSRSLKQAEAVQLHLNAEVGQLFSIGTGVQAQQHGARFDDTQMLSRIERLLDQAQAVGGQHERAALSQSDMLVLKLGSGQGKQPDTREDGLPAWRKKSEHVQGVEVGELREMLQKVGALPVQGGKVSAERQLVNPFVAAAPKPYDVEAHSPLFSGGEASASGSSGESASASSGSPLAPSMPSYDQMVKLSDRVYKFIMKKLRQDLNRY